MRTISLGLTTILFLAAAAGGALAQEVEFNYNGRVSVQGHPFDGAGMFKFSLLNHDADITFWANDGATLDGSEPTTHVLVSVENGFFSVDIGDTSLSGMTSLDASIFNGDERVYLRTWFSDGVQGFELLQPDRRIVNPALLGTQNFDEIALYVNPATGDDRYAGLKANRPKKTIQAAWDTLPPLLRKNATIYLDEGTYREEVAMTGKTLLANSTVTITRNPSASTDPIVCGSDATATTTILRSGFVLTNQKNVCVSHLSFTWCYAGIRAENGSSVEVSDCSMTDSESYGLYINEMSTGHATRLTIARGHESHGWQWAIRASNSSVVFVDSCTISDYYVTAVAAHYHSRAYVKDTSSSRCTDGYQSHVSSYLGFEGTNYATDSFRGASASVLSYLCYANWYVVYSGCTQNVASSEYSVTYH